MILKPDKKSNNYTSAAIGIPVTLGHRYCVPKCHYCQPVPQKMGWLWTSRNVPAHKFDPAWRPGAVLRSVYAKQEFPYGRVKRKKGGNLNKSTTRSTSKRSITSLSKKGLLKSKSKLKNVPKPEALDDSSIESEDDTLKPMFLLRRTGGAFRMSLQQVKNINDRKIMDYPYEINIPPVTVSVSDPDVPKKLTIERKLKKQKLQSLERRILLEQAIDAMCRQIYQNINKAKLIEETDFGDRCPCSYVQEHVLKYLSKAYGTRKVKKSERNIIQTVIQEERILKPNADPIGISSDDEWIIEFTPPCAKYDPEGKDTGKKDAEQQTIKARTDSFSPSKSTTSFAVK